MKPRISNIVHFNSKQYILNLVLHAVAVQHIFSRERWARARDNVSEGSRVSLKIFSFFYNKSHQLILNLKPIPTPPSKFTWLKKWHGYLENWVKINTQRWSVCLLIFHFKSFWMLYLISSWLTTIFLKCS